LEEFAMKKRVGKLTLNRETLRDLDPDELKNAEQTQGVHGADRTSLRLCPSTLC
jgi:hypothetical protein